MLKSTLFQSNQTQALRLPKDVAFPSDVREVTILRDGPRRILTPAGATWDDVFDAPGVDLGPREQGEASERLPF